MKKPKRVSMLGTERHTLKSQSTGKSYEISVALPYAYVDDGLGAGPFSKPPSTWHVIYLIDSNWYFGLVTDLVRVMSWCGRTSDAIVVGIGYPQSDSPQETWYKTAQLRSEDLTHVRIEKNEALSMASLKRPVKTGGGHKFLSFLKQDLVPWVERTYNADPTKRILAGHSYGGLFSLFAMFQEPGLFRSYIAASPSFDDPERTIFALEREFAENHNELDAELYLAAGDLEESAEDTTLSDMYRLAAKLESRNYKGLALTKQLFTDNNHCEVAPPSLHAGLKLALRK